MKKYFCLIIFFCLQIGSFADLSQYGVIPLKLETGARYLGLGSAGSAIAYDANSVFYNPGAIVWSKGVALNVRDSGNLSAVESFPTGYGSSVGIGFLVNSLSNIPNSSGKNISLSSSAMVLSAGARFGSTGVGLSVKNLFNQSLAATGAFDMAGTGWEADIGVLHRYSPWLDIGLTDYNILSYKTLGGGSLNWNNAKAESIPAYFKIGSSAMVIGDTRSPIYMEDNNVLVAADMEINKKPLFHLGCEWTRASQYSFRLGWSQNLRQNEVQNDISFGAGLRFPEWQFDAVSCREPLNGDGIYCFSASYFPSGWFFIAKPIESISLADNVKTYQPSIEVRGKVRPEVNLFINSKPVPTNADGTFSYFLPLDLGQNIAKVETVYMGEKQSAEYGIFRKSPPAKAANIYFLPTGSNTTYDDHIDITGIVNEGIDGISVNGDPAFIGDGTFKSTIPLKVGKNDILVEGKYDDSSVTDKYAAYRRPQLKTIAPPPVEVVEKAVPALPEIKEAPAPTRYLPAVKKFKLPPIAKKPMSLLERQRKMQAAADKLMLEKQRKEDERLKAEQAKRQQMIARMIEEQSKEQQKLKAEELRELQKQEDLIRQASLEAERLLERVRREQKNFEELQNLIRQAANVTISKRVNMKLPGGYLSVYVLTDGRYIALRNAGGGRIDIDLYQSETGLWSTIAHLPYSKVKSLI